MIHIVAFARIPKRALLLVWFEGAWQCPEDDRFWVNISSFQAILLDGVVPHSQHLLLLNDTSSIKLTIKENDCYYLALPLQKKF